MSTPIHLDSIAQRSYCFLFKYDASRDQDIYSLRKAKEAVIKETDSLFKVLSFIKM